MLYVLVGENVYRRDEELASIVAGRPIERINGDDLEASDVADDFAGQTLFSSDDVTVVRDLSANTASWQAMERWLEGVLSSGDAWGAPLEEIARHALTHKDRLRVDEI